MCSKCNGAQDRNGADCEKNPPPPVRCSSSAGCMIAREYNKFGACRGIYFLLLWENDTIVLVAVFLQKLSSVTL